MPLLFLNRLNGKHNLNNFNENYPPPINFLPVFLILMCLALAWSLISGYQDRAITIEEIERSLTPEELESYRAAQKEVDEKFEKCIQYILYALKDGSYQCASCPPGIPFVTLKEGEIWYIGHTCQKEDIRHSPSFQKKHRVWMATNFVGSKNACH